LIRQEAEIKLARLGSGAVPWSPRLKKVGDTIKYWQLALNQMSGQRVRGKTLYRLEKSLGVSSIGMGVGQIKSTLDDAYGAYKRVKTKAWGYRKTYLWDKALALEKDDGLKASKHIQWLIWIEEQRKQARAVNKREGYYKLWQQWRLHSQRTGIQLMCRTKKNWRRHANNTIYEGFHSHLILHFQQGACLRTWVY